ncbi:MAG TPA: hypothetical protein VIY73_19885 [Polyangiaceae bacterium]
MRKLLCLVLVVAPFLGACASFGMSNPQTEWTTTEGPGDPPVTSLDPPDADDVWVPYVDFVAPLHHEHSHERVAQGARAKTHGGHASASHHASHGR